MFRKTRGWWGKGGVVEVAGSVPRMYGKRGELLGGVGDGEGGGVEERKRSGEGVVLVEEGSRAGSSVGEKGGNA